MLVLPIYTLRWYSLKNLDKGAVLNSSTINAIAQQSKALLARKTKVQRRLYNNSSSVSDVLRHNSHLTHLAPVVFPGRNGVLVPSVSCVVFAGCSLLKRTLTAFYKPNTKQRRGMEHPSATWPFVHLSIRLSKVCNIYSDTTALHALQYPEEFRKYPGKLYMEAQRLRILTSRHMINWSMCIQINSGKE